MEITNNDLVQEINKTRERIEKIEKDVEDIKDNHLNTIWSALDGVLGSIECLFHEVGNLRWWIAGCVGLLAVVIAVIQCLT